MPSSFLNIQIIIEGQKTFFFYIFLTTATFLIVYVTKNMPLVLSLELSVLCQFNNNYYLTMR